MFRDGSDVGDRTAAKLAEGQNESSYNVTDFIVNANNQLWEETFYKVCLLHWNDIVKSEPEDKADMLNTRFDLKIKTKATDYEKQRLEQDIQRYSQVPDAMGNPSLTLKDAIMLREIDDYKLACWYLSATYEKNRKAADKQKADIVNQTAQQQQASNAQTGQNAIALEEQKHKWKMEEITAQQQGEDRAGLTTGLLNILAKTGGEVPETLKPLFSQVMQNISIGIVLDNAHTKQSIQEAASEAMPTQSQGQPTQQQQMQPQ